jgi:tetratricopeptide (TPR) repeat protein
VLEEALRLAPDIPEAHANLGQAYRRSDRFRQAIAASRRALEPRPDYRDAYLNPSVAAFEVDDFEVALDASRRALEIDATCGDELQSRLTLSGDRRLCRSRHRVRSGHRRAAGLRAGNM